MRHDVLRATILALVMAFAAGLAVYITPRSYLADQFPREKLAQIVPLSFAGWEVDKSILPVPPSPDVQQVLDETYDETLALTFRNREGKRVMLSMAYGRNQHKGMNIHRPEVCYPAQGFKLLSSVPAIVAVGHRQIEVTRAVASLGSRNEPITYWLLVGERVTRFGYPQRAEAIRYGLRGTIPDGVLVRISSIEPDSAAGFRLQEQFIQDILAAIEPARIARILGRA